MKLTDKQRKEIDLAEEIFIDYKGHNIDTTKEGAEKFCHSMAAVKFTNFGTKDLFLREKTIQEILAENIQIPKYRIRQITYNILEHISLRSLVYQELNCQEASLVDEEDGKEFIDIILEKLRLNLHIDAASIDEINDIKFKEN